jgi:hypothetical protein
MDDLTRRDVLKSIAAASAVPELLVQENRPVNYRMTEEEKKLDRQRVIACGLTEAEADCWVALADAIGQFFMLPKLHPSDAAEVAQATHVIQEKLLSRPVYRKYLELAKAAKDKK